MNDENPNNEDPFIDPSNLKDDEKIDPGELIESLKKSDGVRWPGALFLMFLTLAVGFGLAMLIFFIRPEAAPPTDPDSGPTVSERTDPPEADDPENNPPIIVDDEMPATIPLGGQQLINGDGTFIEWYSRQEEADLDIFPRFVDLTWHPGTERIYLVAHDKNLYWIDSSRTQIEHIDLSLRLGESLPWLDKVAVIDQDRLLLQMGNNEQPFVIYNLKNNRVEKRFGKKSESGELGTFFSIQDIGVSPNGTIYLHNRYKKADEFFDQMQVFDSQGEPIHVFPLTEKFADAFAIHSDGSIWVMGGYRGLYQYDLDGALLDAIESDNFDHVADMAIDKEGNLFFVRAFDAWLIEFQQDEQFGQIYGPAHEFTSETWDLGQVTHPQAFIRMPSGDEFVILDGTYFQRIFLFQPAN